jgi:hypothetical protein
MMAVNGEVADVDNADTDESLLPRTAEHALGQWSLKKSGKKRQDVKLDNTRTDPLPIEN